MNDDGKTKPSESRQRALDELKRLMKDQRGRLDPAVLARAAAALSGGPAPAPATVPYDRAAATKAIEIFMATHKDKADFKARLFSFIQKQSH